MQEQNRKSSFPIVMLLVSVALWIASLSNVAFYLGNHGSMEGLTVLILGSIFASLDIRYCAVYANYVWLAAIVLLALRKKVVPVHAALWGLALVGKPYTSMKQGIHRILCATVQDFICGMPHLRLPPSVRLPERIRKEKPHRRQTG